MKLFKFTYKIIRNRKLLLITLAVVLAIIIIFPILILKLSTAVTRANILRNNPLAVKVLPLYWQVRKISDIFYLPYYFKKNKLPSYELTIKDGDLEKLNNSLPKEFMNVELISRVFVPAEFKYDNKTYQVEVRYRGDNAVHWNAPKKSYLIEFNQDDLFNGYRKLSFIIPNDRYFALEQLNNYRAEKFGLLYPPSFFAGLKINGKNNGLYFVVESWSKEMLAKWEVPDESNFYGTTSPTGAAGIERDDILWDNLDHWQKLIDDSLFTYQHYSELYKLLELLNNADNQKFYSSIFNLIDQNNLYHWQVLQELSNANHQISSNMRLYFNNSSGKFYFIPWDVGGGGDYGGRDNLDLYGRLTARIFSNPEFLHEKNKILYDYAGNEDNLKDDLAFYDQTYNEIKTDLYKDRIKIYSNRFADGLNKEFRQRIIDNFDKIKNDYQAAIIFSEISLTDDNSQKFNGQYVLAYLDITVKSLADLFLKDIDPKFIAELKFDDYRLYYDANFNHQLDWSDKLIENYQDALLFSQRVAAPEQLPHKYRPELTKHRFYLTSRPMSGSQFSDNLKSFKLNLENAITGQKIKNNEINLRIINQSVFEYFDLIADIGQFITLNPIFKVNQASREIILPSGSYAINKTIIVPKGYTLKIFPGASLSFAPGASLVSYSHIIAEGTASAPIKFMAQSEKPWGVVAVLNSDQPSLFSYCKFSNGQDDYVNGTYLSGQLSVYFSPVTISHSEFTAAHADDSLNVKHATAELSDNQFLNNSADGIDFDFVKNGFIKNSQFNHNGNDSIDLSGSAIIIENNTIKNSGDKCISIGEKSLNTIIYNNLLNSCKIGIETKDLSDIKIINNVIINNQIGLNGYQKKPVFGGGQAQVYNSIIWDNGRDVQTDDQSQITIFNSAIKNISANNNFELAPKFNPDFTIKAGGDNILFNTAGNKEVLKEFLNIELSQAPVGLNK